MSDIVEQTKRVASQLSTERIQGWMNPLVIDVIEAADEITRLRAGKNDMTDDLTISYQLGVEDMRSRLHKQADEIERLQQLNEYLRSEKERLSKDVYNLILKELREISLRVVRSK